MDPGAITDPLPIRNRPHGASLPASVQVSTDFLQLVRLGLRDPGDGVIRDSIRVIDLLLRADTPSGPAWRRYNSDGYGERADGSPYCGSGEGRPWPLLTGERGHFELIAGLDPLPLLQAMAAMSSVGGMIPEQVWDADPITARRLAPGRPSGAAMPLAWAHAEFTKLLVSRHMGQPVDRPRTVWHRYRGRPAIAKHAFWLLHAPIADMQSRQSLAVAVPGPAAVRWGVDGWQSTTEIETQDTGLGLHVAAIEPPQGADRIDFTVRWSASGEWIGRDFAVSVVR
jgi:glucoamylase